MAFTNTVYFHNWAIPLVVVIKCFVTKQRYWGSIHYRLDLIEKYPSGQVLCPRLNQLREESYWTIIAWPVGERLTHPQSNLPLENVAPRVNIGQQGHRAARRHRPQYWTSRLLGRVTLERSYICAEIVSLWDTVSIPMWRPCLNALGTLHKMRGLA